MSIKDLLDWHKLQGKGDPNATAESSSEDKQREGHRHDHHFSLEDGFSRRRFIRTAAGAAGATGLVLGSGLAIPVLADDDDDRKDDRDECGSELCNLPVPIPHLGPTPFGTMIHGFFPGPVEGTAAPTDPTGAHPDGRDPSQIFNFEGFIGQADLNLAGTGKDLATGATGRYEFHTDMRFMKGAFVGTDGIERRSTFVFV